MVENHPQKEQQLEKLFTFYDHDCPLANPSQGVFKIPVISNKQEEQISKDAKDHNIYETTWLEPNIENLMLSIAKAKETHENNVAAIGKKPENGLTYNGESLYNKYIKPQESNLAL